MAKVKVNFNPGPIDRSIIKKHKDFGKFIHNYQKYYSSRGIRYMFRYERKKLVFIVLILIFLLLMLFTDGK